MAVSQIDLTSDVRNMLPVANGGAGGGVNLQTGTTYTITAADNRKLVAFNNASPVAVTLTAAATLGTLFVCWVENLGAGTVTITPASGTIDGASSLALNQNQGVVIWSDGTNFYTGRGMGSGGGGGGVTSLDGITGAVSLVAGSGVTITDNSPSAGDITIAAAGGAVPSATSVAVTTASLANGASQSGSVAIFKSFMLLEVQYSCKARVELYSTAAARDADASRPWGTPPTLYAQNQIIQDLQNSTGPMTWIMSPAAFGFNADSPRTTTIYYRITNLDSAQAVTVTLTVLQMES